jgi:HNH endonuclease
MTRYEQLERHRESQRKYRLANPEKCRAACHRWSAVNKKRKSESNRLWRMTHRIRKRTNARRWYLANKERLREYSKTYRIRNIAMRRVWNSARKARIRAAVIGSNEAILAIYKRCHELRRWFNVEVDHIIPLMHGGTHSPDNLQIIYASDNARKHVSLNYIPKVVFR